MSDEQARDELGERLKAFEGRPAGLAGVGKDPVNAPMIRHWCEALGDTHPAYTGPDAIAPPTMLQVWTMGGLSGHPGRTGAYEELLGLLDAAGCTAVVATDCEQEYPRPLRPGDEVAFDTVIEEVSGRKTTRLGTGYFITTRTEVRVAGEPAGVHRFRILKYAPAPRRSQELRQHRQGSESRQSRHRQDPESPRPLRPRPVVNRDNAGFWQGVAERRLLIQRCTACGTPRHPWLPGCNACGGLGWDTVEASGEGTVYSYVVVHHPPVPGFDLPYAVVLVELAEGVRMVGNVVGVPYDEVRIGMPVRAGFRRVDEELTLPVFQPVTETAPMTETTAVPAVER
ncbi:bifunctional MaoC family dehydratase N-terminal/OB-fold nucleic acid binding domain-containing protein [Streptomyces achromogenes]|uniref:bifunctional MaoC family dehydratase N-terminal/OB-fold nucleic acid binding domain-containing protein n=1 Tax=Streptomyces achromogenes TaxID=67255 RepID=UPI0036C3CBC6